MCSLLPGSPPTLEDVTAAFRFNIIPLLAVVSNRQPEPLSRYALMYLVTNSIVAADAAPCSICNLGLLMLILSYKKLAFPEFPLLSLLTVIFPRPSHLP